MCYIVVSENYRELGFLATLPDHEGDSIVIGVSDEFGDMRHVALAQRSMHRLHEARQWRRGPMPHGEIGTEFLVYVATGDTAALDTWESFRPSYPISGYDTAKSGMDFDCGLLLLGIEHSGLNYEKCQPQPVDCI